ncbi:hypothetical protein RHGRI_006389 [Rhododendron griersonianum]|uniref:Uncharacterized protein n=1 Tax=Rhododendron griersonianum TaxID=479676 RepID=A0AAV6KT24_9ERIC|nr:hypothetical protein RHGRI_006389 [Rhododendron griersonianum]
MRTELGGALADLLNENRKGYGDNEMGYVERTLGFRTWILDDRDLRLIMGYLSGSSPHIKSGAVSALSVLVHNNAEICLLVPDLVPSVLALLQTKAVEVIKVTVILEILMRRCGSAQVKLVTPEKHLNFVKGILENRHGKASPKESSATDMELEVLESSPRRMQRKRKREEPSIPSEEDGKVESRFRKRGMKLKKRLAVILLIDELKVNHVEMQETRGILMGTPQLAETRK